MGDLKSRIAYIKGLAAGLNIEESSREGQLFSKIIEALDLIAEEIEELRDDYDELFEYTESIDEDLSELEDDYYETDGDTAADEEDDDVITLECPECGDITYIDPDFLDSENGQTEIYCPNCERMVFIDDQEWDTPVETIDEEEPEEEGKS